MVIWCLFACWHFVSMFWRCYVIRYHLTIRMVCVCVCVSVCFFEILFAPHLFADMWFGRSRREGKTLMLLKSTSQQVNFTKSLRVWCSFFFCFDVDHGAQFFRGTIFSGKKLPLEVLNQGWKTQNVASVATGQWVQHHLWCAEVQGVERDWRRQWMAYFLDSPLHLAWSRDWYMLTAEICWHIPGTYLAYTWC